jgi:hypothetical protein
MKINNLTSEIQMLIYEFVPIIYNKFCNKKSYNNYLHFFLPESYNDWNMENILLKYNKDMIYDFLKKKINNIIIHRIFLRVKSEKLEKFFINHFSQMEDPGIKEVFNVIVEECNDDKNCYIALPHHYIIIQCLTDILTKKLYHKWLKSPEEKYKNIE